MFTDRDRSIWVDLAIWPPVLIERDEATLAAARSPGDVWLAYVRRGDRLVLRWYDGALAGSPSREVAEPLGELGDAPRFDSVHMHGERALIVPRNSGQHPYLEVPHGWAELVKLPAFETNDPRERCASACVRLGDGRDALVWDGRVFVCDVELSPHRLALAWYHDYAPVAFGPSALLACDGGTLVELAADRVVPHLPGVAATGIRRGPGETFVVETHSVPIWWSPREDWACELPPEVLGRRSDVVGIAPDGGLVVYDRRGHELAHVPATELAALPRRRASQAPSVAVAAPIAILDDRGAASRTRIAGVGEQLACISDRSLRFHVAERAAGIEHWASPIVAVAHDGRHVAAIDTRGTLRVLGAAAGPLSVRVAGVPRALMPVRSSPATPGGVWLVVVAQGAWLVDFAAIGRGARPEPIALPGAITAAIDPAGTILFVAERARLATWAAGRLVELPPTIEQLVACAPLGRGRFACAGERHLFAFDVAAAELELFELDGSYATMRAPYVAASPSGRVLAWTATPTSIHVAAVRGTKLEIVLEVGYGAEYGQPLDTPLAVRGLALTSETSLAIALDHGRGNLIDLDGKTARKLYPQLGDDASRWIVFVNGKPLIAE